jgi:hypothetical protein
VALLGLPHPARTNQPLPRARHWAKAARSQGGAELGDSGAKLRGGGAELLETRGGKQSRGRMWDAAGDCVPQQGPQPHGIPKFGDADPVFAGDGLRGS